MMPPTRGKSAKIFPYETKEAAEQMAFSYRKEVARQMYIQDIPLWLLEVIPDDMSHMVDL
jgi:hypothetical protein